MIMKTAYMYIYSSAVAENYSATIKQFLQRSCKCINEQGYHYYTPLHIVANNKAIKAIICIIHNRDNVKK